MPKFKINKRVPRSVGYRPGQVVEVKAQNVGVWRERPWATLVRGKEVETAERAPAPENAARRTGKAEARQIGDSTWYEIVVDGRVVGKVNGQQARDEALGAHNG